MFRFLVVLIVLSALMLTPAKADQFGDFGYTTNGNSVIITNYSGAGGTVIIPNSINGLPVTTIGSYSFYARSSLIDLTIPNGVTSIASHAFEECAQLSEVALPGTLTNIGDYAFLDCTDATNIAIPTGLVSVGAYAFKNCELLGEANLPASVRSIGTGAFQQCYRLASITIPNGITNIPDWTFYRCAGLTNVSIPNSVASIGNSAFGYCSGLRQIVLPESVTNIGAAAFSSCLQMRIVTISGRNGALGDSAFASCFALTGLYFQSQPPAAIGAGVFAGDNYATVYYRAGTGGWGATFGGLPTALWNPLIHDLGFETNQFRFEVTGPTNLAVVVEACSDLRNPIWTAVATNSLTDGSYSFTDADWTNHPGRFYRVRSQQSAESGENGIWRQPPLFIDSWYHYGPFWTSTVLSNEFSVAYSSGLSSLWDIWYIMDDGWQGGITNGILMPNLAKFNITNIVAHAHANGVKMLLYVEPLPISSAGFPSLGTNWEANARVWKAWGIDGLKVDMTAGDPYDFSDRLRILGGLLADARKGYVQPLAIFTGGWRDAISAPGTSNFFGEQVTAIANATRIVTDDSMPSLPTGWNNYVANYVTAYERNKALNRPGHWLHLDVSQVCPPGLGQDGTNVSRGTITFNALMSTPMDVPLIGDPVGDPTRYFDLSRPGIIKLHQDAPFYPATRIYSNALGSVWCRPLSWGGKAVVFLNHQADAVYSTNVNWVDIGFQSNQLCGVYDVWNSNIVTNDYGKFSAAVSNMSAFAYFIYPTNASPLSSVRTSTGSPIQTWSKGLMPTPLRLTSDSNNTLRLSGRDE